MYRSISKTTLCLFLMFCLAAPVVGVYSDRLSSPSPTPDVRDWTVMVYVGADSDFYDNSENQVSDFTLKQLRKAFVDPYGAAGAGTLEADQAGVHLVVLTDALNSTGVHVHDGASLSADSEEEDFAVLPESACSFDQMDTSDPATLSWFIGYARDNYPAEKYLLFVKNGHAWCGACPDFGRYHGVPWDVVQETEVPMMPVSAIADILGGFEKQDGRNMIDVLVLDGDNMATFENAYELRNSVDYMVASQQEVPIDGFPYYLVMSRLMAGVDDVGPEELASDICEDYLLYHNCTQGKKNDLPHLLSDSQEANIVASAFRMVNDQGQNNLELMADAFLKIVRYMLSGEGATERTPKDHNDSFPDSDLWDWIPVHRNAIASARDYALIGKMADQQGYEWLPDVQSFITYLQAYLWEFAEDWGWEPDQDLRDMGMAFKEVFNNSRIGLAKCQIFDRDWDCGCNPEGLNFWFPQNWQHWDDLENVSRDIVYGYDEYGALIDIPREYYCIDCPVNYSKAGLGFVADYPGLDIEETPLTELWMQFYDIYYDSRWILYCSGEGQPKPQTSKP